MNSLRLEQEETQSKNEELQAKVKNLEQENLAKEQEITSLAHKNQLLESEVEKLETGVKEHKDIISKGSDHATQNESLQRRLQLLEEEAEESDRNIRETNEKYTTPVFLLGYMRTVASIWLTAVRSTGYAKPTSRPATTSARCRLSRARATSGRRSTRRCPRSTIRRRKSWRTFSSRLATSEVEKCVYEAYAIRHVEQCRRGGNRVERVIVQR